MICIPLENAVVLFDTFISLFLNLVTFYNKSKGRHIQKTLSYLCVCDRDRTDASVHRVPGASSQHTSKEGVQISSPESAAVTLHPGQVPVYQRHPQPTVVHPKIWLQDLEGRDRNYYYIIF